MYSALFFSPVKNSATFNIESLYFWVIFEKSKYKHYSLLKQFFFNRSYLFKRRISRVRTGFEEKCLIIIFYTELSFLGNPNINNVKPAYNTKSSKFKIKDGKHVGNKALKYINYKKFK